MRLNGGARRHTSYFLLSTSYFGIHRVTPDATADDHEDRRPGTNGAFYFLRLRVWGGEESRGGALSKGVFWRGPKLGCD